MRILAIDPGLRTGMAWGPIDAPNTEIEDPMPALDLAQQLLGHDLDLVVCEAYKITARTAQLSAQHWSLELIGALRWMCHRHGVPFELQTPAEAKSLVPDARLRQMGLWVPGKEDHARDALRHMVLGLARKRQIQLRAL